MPAPATIAPFPADDPIWNTGGANRVAPTTGKQALGWTLEEEPPSATFNWWMFYVGEYVQHYKAAIAALYEDRLSRHGGEIDGSMTFAGDQFYNIGTSSVRLKTLFTGRVDLIELLPWHTGASIGTSLRKFDTGYINDIFADDVDTATLTVGLGATFGGAVTMQDDLAVNGNLTVGLYAGEGSGGTIFLGEGGYAGPHGVRTLNTNRAIVSIVKPANVAWDYAFHVGAEVNIGLITASSNELTVEFNQPMLNTNYGVSWSGCRNLGLGNTDIVLHQVHSKTTTRFKVIFYYLSGGVWTPMTLSTVNANNGLNGLLTVVGAQ
jgi:hypothetical protein